MKIQWKFFSVFSYMTFIEFSHISSKFHCNFGDSTFNRYVPMKSLGYKKISWYFHRQNSSSAPWSPGQPLLGHMITYISFSSESNDKWDGISRFTVQATMAKLWPNLQCNGDKKDKKKVSFISLSLPDNDYFYWSCLLMQPFEREFNSEQNSELTLILDCLELNYKGLFYCVWLQPVFWLMQFQWKYGTVQL